MKPNPSKCTKHTTESHRKYLLIPMVSLFCFVLFRALQSRLQCTHPLVTAKSVPTRGSHPNARSAASAGICRHRAASGRINNAWTSDATRDCLKVEHTRVLLVSTNAYSTRRVALNDDAPPNALADTQHVPSLLSEQETRKFGCREVVHDCEADGGDEESV